VANKKCEHGQRQAYCVECGGSQICQHRKRRQRCRVCKGLGPRFYPRILIVDGMMMCRTCRVSKPLSEFYDRGDNGRKIGECKLCLKIRTIQYGKDTKASRWNFYDASSARKAARNVGTSATLTAYEWKAVVEYHGYKCYMCTTLLTTEPNQPNTITLEHILPLSRGGTSTKENVAPACFLCNCAKRNMSIEEFRDKVRKWYGVLCGE